MALTVVIPTLNAAAHLPATLAALGHVPELIIADAASTDATTTIAIAHNARIIQAPRGRGTQLAAGIAAATNPWLLLLHADTSLAPNWRAALNTDPAKAGYFRFALDSATPAARRLENRVAWRCKTLALPYGDQALHIHRDLLTAAGGIRPIPLMEDVDLIRRLGRHRLTELPATATTSAEKYQRQGYRTRSARNLLCLSLWFAGVPPHLIARLYG